MKKLLAILSAFLLASNLYATAFAEEITEEKDNDFLTDMQFSQDVQSWLNGVGFDYDKFSSHTFVLPEMQLDSKTLSENYNNLMTNLIIDGYGEEYTIDFELPTYTLDVKTAFSESWGEGLAPNYKTYSVADLPQYDFGELVTQSQANKLALYEARGDEFTSSECFQTFSRIKMQSLGTVDNFLANNKLSSYSSLLDRLEGGKNTIQSITYKEYEKNNQNLGDGFVDYESSFNSRKNDMKDSYEKYKTVSDMAGTDANDADFLGLSDEAIALYKKYGSIEAVKANAPKSEKYKSNMNVSPYAGASTIYSSYSDAYKELLSYESSAGKNNLYNPSKPQGREDNAIISGNNAKDQYEKESSENSAVLNEIVNGNEVLKDVIPVDELNLKNKFVRRPMQKVLLF